MIEVLRHRFRFSIDLILVTLYTLSRSTPYIAVFGLTYWKFTKDGAREKRNYLTQLILESQSSLFRNLNHQIFYKEIILDEFNKK